MIHDWLFVANHCVIDGMATPEQEVISGMSFETSAVIIAEAIKALQEAGQVAQNDVAPQGDLLCRSGADCPAGLGADGGLRGP